MRGYGMDSSPTRLERASEKAASLSLTGTVVTTQRRQQQSAIAGAATMIVTAHSNDSSGQQQESKQQYRDSRGCAWGLDDPGRWAALIKAFF